MSGRSSRNSLAVSRTAPWSTNSDAQLYFILGTLCDFSSIVHFVAMINLSAWLVSWSRTHRIRGVGTKNSIELQFRRNVCDITAMGIAHIRESGLYLNRLLKYNETWM